MRFGRYLVVLCSLSCSVDLFSLPMGLEIEMGRGEVNLCSPEIMEIVVDDRAILNWQDFSVGSSETVLFVQPQSSSCVLNRVVGENPSHILGSLKANGKLILINQQGVLFGNQSTISVCSLIASTLDLHTQVFLNESEWRFSGNSENCIQNFGKVEVSGGQLVLAAKKIENGGSLIAQNGAVSIAAAKEIAFSKCGTINLLATGSEGFVDLSGLIRASHIEIRVQGTPYQRSFQQTGDLIALGNKGQIHLSVFPGDIHCNGTLQAQNSDGSGGVIHLLGQRIALQENAFIDVCGNEGGTLLVGGDYQGKNLSIPNAEMVFMHPSAICRANAIGKGNGGRIILWSEDSTQMYGSISCRGGDKGGDGGFIEISSKGILDFHGVTDRTASLGTAGLLLLDPHNVNVTAVANSANITFGVCAPRTYCTNPVLPSPSNIQAANIIANLVGGPVTVSTGDSGGAFGNLGDISISTVISWPSANPLTFTAARNIVLNTGANITSTAAGASLTMNAGGQIDLRANITTGTAVNGNAPIVLTAGSNILVGNTGATASNVTTVGPNSPVTMSAGNDILFGSLAISAAVRIGTTNGDVTLAACRDVIIQAGITGRNAIIGSRSGNSSGNLNVSAGRDLSILTAAAGTSNYAAITRLALGAAAGNTVTGDININVRRNLNMNGQIVATRESFIGHGSFNNNVVANPNATGNININVGQDLIMVGGTIGANSIPNPAVGGGYRSVIRVNVARDIVMTLGSYLGSGGPITGAGMRLTWYITVGRNLLQGVGFLQPMNDADLTGNAALIAAYPPLMDIRIGGDHRLIAANSTIGHHGQGNNSPMLTRSRVGGSILLYNSFINAAQPTTYFKRVSGNTVGSYDVQAGGDIQMAGPGNANIFSRGATFIADAQIPSGSLWTPQVAIVCGTNIFTGTLFAADNPAFSTNDPTQSGGDGLGAFTTQTGLYNTGGGIYAIPVLISAGTISTSYSSTFGDLVVRSSDRFVNGSFADYTLGFGGNQDRWTANTGNIFIEGFRDTFVRGANPLRALVGSATVNTIRDFNGINGSMTAGTNVSVGALRDVNLTNFTSTAGVDTLMIANENMTLRTNAAVLSGRNVDLVIDNEFPSAPFYGATHIFSMDASSRISSASGYIRVYTSLQSLNAIDPMAQFISGGVPFFFSAGTLFTNTNSEQWCTYYPTGSLGTPFRIFYKNCLQLVAQQAQIVISEFLTTLEPMININFPYFGFNEYYGWPSRFVIFYRLFQGPHSKFYNNLGYEGYLDRAPEKYFIHRRNEVLVDSERMREFLKHNLFSE